MSNLPTLAFVRIDDMPLVVRVDQIAALSGDEVTGRTILHLLSGAVLTTDVLIDDVVQKLIHARNAVDDMS